ncbi:hypothetical protein JNUCC23_02085 [Peribacillus sp. JNUCC 23]
MGKDKHINPSLSPSRNSSTVTSKRKVRSDKLHDIKIPIHEGVDLILRRESRRHWNGSKTSLGTDILLFGLEEIFIYPDVSYQDGPFTVHCKVNHDTYQRIGKYADEWKCSMRKAAHRIFTEAYKKKQLGGITDEEI